MKRVPLGDPTCTFSNREAYTDQSIRFDIDHGVTPGKEPAECGHEPARGIFGAPGSHLVLLVQGKLFAEEQVFGSQPSPGSDCQHEQKSKIDEHLRTAREQCRVPMRNPGERGSET